MNITVDETEPIRREMTDKINAVEGDRLQLEATYGKVWDTGELRQDFEVLGFAAPFCIVRRRADGVEGTLAFQHFPRFYFAWAEV